MRNFQGIIILYELEHIGRFNNFRILWHETDNFNGWPEIKWWNLIRIICIAIIDVSGVE